MSPSAADGAATAAPNRIEFDDPHAAGIGNLQEAEVSRVRALRGAWRWALIVATAVTILLCINQQFTLRFFIGYTQLNTEYFYLLIALMLPFTFLIFPGSETRSARADPVVRHPALRADLRCLHRADAQRPQGGGGRLGIRRRTDQR